MTIDEAIKRIADVQLEFLPLPRHIDWKALQLGIEALKLISRHRKYPLAVPIGPLPGETEE